MKLLVFLLLLCSLFSQKKDVSRSKKVVEEGYINTGRLKAYISNRGSLFRKGSDKGLIYPNPSFRPNENLTGTIYSTGLWIGAKLKGDLRVAMAEYAYDYVPGEIFSVDENGDALYNSNYENNSEYKIYYKYSDQYRSYLQSLIAENGQLYEFALSEISRESNDWETAVKQGAPNDPPGDVNAYCVFHDGDQINRDKVNQNTKKLNIEVHQLVYGFHFLEELKNTVFIKYDFVNKNSAPLDSTYISIWTDADMGNYNDDLSGADFDQKNAIFL